MYLQSFSDSAHDGKHISSGARPGTRWSAISGTSSLKALTLATVDVTAISHKLVTPAGAVEPKRWFDTYLRVLWTVFFQGLVHAELRSKVRMSSSNDFPISSVLALETVQCEIHGISAFAGRLEITGALESEGHFALKKLHAERSSNRSSELSAYQMGSWTREVP